MKKLLVLVLSLQGMTSFFGGIELIRTNGMGMPIEWLANSPFDSFLIPGLILMTVIGGTSFAASYLLLKKHRLQHEASAIAGFGILIMDICSNLHDTTSLFSASNLLFFRHINPDTYNEIIKRKQIA